MPYENPETLMGILKIYICLHGGGVCHDTCVCVGGGLAGTIFIHPDISTVHELFGAVK